MFENPFAAPGQWYRANLHAHTTNSDGDIAPADCAALYRREGYQVLAITDHWCVTELPNEHDNFLLLPGVEFDIGRTAQGHSYHLVALNVTSRGKLARSESDTPQGLIDRVRAEGGEMFVAHPYWSGLMASDIMALQHCFAVEVYNTGCDLEILRGYSSVHWDDLLTLGHPYGALAVDDGHRHAVDHGYGWTMIRAAALTPEAIMEALRRGHYYASLGPEILDLQVADGSLRVTTSPVASIALVSAPGQGGREFAAPGGTITEATFSLPRARYARVEIIDAQGRTAWSNPVLLG